ncbi:uncharacterized protein LOC144108643 [Amblyomma americanum]
MDATKEQGSAKSSSASLSASNSAGSKGSDGGNPRRKSSKKRVAQKPNDAGSSVGPTEAATAVSEEPKVKTKEEGDADSAGSAASAKSDRPDPAVAVAAAVAMAASLEAPEAMDPTSAHEPAAVQRQPAASGAVEDPPETQLRMPSKMVQRFIGSCSLLVVLIAIIIFVLLLKRNETSTTASGGTSTSAASATAPPMTLTPTTSPKDQITTTTKRSGTHLPLSENIVPGSPAANTTSGQLKGSKVDVGGVVLDRWLAVAYAARGMRFKPAEPRVRSDRPSVDVSPMGSSCAQLVGGRLVGSEDCLHVNVWAPAQPPPDGALRPLVLALTADWFSRGSNNVGEWEQLAAKGSLVVMSPNVRLGVLGFLGPRSSVGFRGDLALNDTRVAVQWALSNAAAFRADPKRMMVVGHGSGAYLLADAVVSLNLTCVRAVLEGPLPGSVLPTNTEEADSWSELATALRCAEDATKWRSCFVDASVADLLAAAANVTFRFVPRWDQYQWRHKGAPLSAGEVIAGVDIAEARAFFREHVKKPAEAKDCASTLVYLYDYTLQYLFLDQTPAHRNVLKLFEPKTEQDIVRLLAALMAGCDTQRLAESARQKGHHYVADGEGKALFEPALDVAAIAAFLENGTVPKLKSGGEWPPFKSTGSSRVVFANGMEELLDTRKSSDTCQDEFFPAARTP